MSLFVLHTTGNGTIPSILLDNQKPGRRRFMSSQSDFKSCVCVARAPRPEELVHVAFIIIDAYLGYMKGCAVEEIDRQHLELALKASGTGVWLWLVAERRAVFCEIVRSLFLNETEDVPTAHLARRFYQAVHPDDVLRVKQAMIDAQTLGCSYETEYRILHPDGNYRTVSAAGKPVFDEHGKAISVQGVLKDVTVEKLLREQAGRLALLEERTEFAAMLAHDLRLPIQGSQLILPKLIEALENGDHTIASGDLLRNIFSGNEGLLLMIDNLIDTYRAEKQEQRIRIGEFDLKEVVQECVDEFAPLALLSELRIDINLGNLANAQGDRYATKRVISNLLSNAVKFNHRKGTVLVEADTSHETARVIISDSGCGISSTDLGNLFVTFWRSNRKYRSYGMGMGLYLCKKLMDMQNGTISCTSEEGHGSKFEISLPICQTFAPHHTKVDVGQRSL